MADPTPTPPTPGRWAWLAKFVPSNWQAIVAWARRGPHHDAGQPGPPPGPGPLPVPEPPIPVWTPPPPGWVPPTDDDRRETFRVLGCRGSTGPRPGRRSSPTPTPRSGGWPPRAGARASRSATRGSSARACRSGSRPPSSTRWPPRCRPGQGPAGLARLLPGGRSTAAPGQRQRRPGAVQRRRLDRRVGREVAGDDGRDAAPREVRVARPDRVRHGPLPDVGRPRRPGELAASTRSTRPTAPWSRPPTRRRPHSPRGTRSAFARTSASSR
jgi:hypothetical protein